jgi:glycosyltransferase involved in cell wall biosynthesis
MLALRRLVRRLRPEVVHSYSFYTNFAAFAATRGTHAVAIGALRSAFDWAVEEDNALLATLNRCWPRTQIFNNSAAAEIARETCRFFVPARVFVIRNGVDLNRFRATELQVNGCPQIVGVGSLRAVKQWDRLIRVAGQMRQQGLNFMVRIIGDGPLRHALQQEIERLELSKVVELTGYRDDVPRELAAATFAVHVAAAEGCPNAVMEAMACGRAVVATDTGDVSAIMEEGKTGFIVPPGNDGKLIERLTALIGNRELCRRMGYAARDKAEREFGLNRLLSETFAAYEAAGWKHKQEAAS